VAYAIAAELKAQNTWMGGAFADFENFIFKTEQMNKNDWRDTYYKTALLFFIPTWCNRLKIYSILAKYFLAWKFQSNVFYVVDMHR